MLDQYNREINYLRLSVTNQCNLRCIYCFIENESKPNKSLEILSVKQIFNIVSSAATLGINKIRLTGGEPLIRKDLPDIISKFSSIKGIDFISITTNGTLLAKKATTLSKAGLSSINISLDTINPYKYSFITRGGNFFDVIKGIDESLNSGIPVKINMVVINNVNELEIESMRSFCKYYGVELQLIRHYNLNESKFDDDIFDRPPKCVNCNKIRLLSDGKIKPCLHSQNEFQIDNNDITGSLIQSILAKPKNGAAFCNRSMVEIGG